MVSYAACRPQSTFTDPKKLLSLGVDTLVGAATGGVGSGAAGGFVAVAKEVGQSAVTEMVKTAGREIGGAIVDKVRADPLAGHGSSSCAPS
jgi:hypothetical protein